MLVSLNTTYKSTLTMSALANNVYSSSPLISASKLVIIDGPSYTLVNQTLAQTATAFTPNSLAPGCRRHYNPFTTDLPPWAMPVSFDNTTSLTSYSEELQISNGLFVTLSTTTTNLAYLNYGQILYNTSINYSLLDANKTRYANFIWKFPNTQTSYNKLSFYIYDITGISLVNSILCCNDTNKTPIKIYYRIINSDNTNPSDFSSVWINANNIDLIHAGSGNWNKGASFQEGSEATIDGIINGVGVGITLNSTTATVSVYMPPPVMTDPNNVYLIFRIGLPMNQNVSFSYVSAMVSV
jgi:hypothetical protein